MIQRVQTVLFLVAAICFAVACFKPIGTITTMDKCYVVTPWSLKALEENNPDGKPIHQTYFIGLLQLTLAVISFVTIFLYKNRPLQSKFCIAATVINFVLLLLMLYVYPDIVFAKLPKIHYYEGQPPWVFLSIIPLACLYFANKFVIKDEKKVRAADRLR